jgi:hypothetical protein
MKRSILLAESLNRASFYRGGIILPAEGTVSSLDLLLSTILERVGQQDSVHLGDENELEPFMACGALMRLALGHAQAASLLLQNLHVEAVAPLERAIYEIWVEFRYLVRFGNRRENARRLFINAALDVAEFTLRKRRLFPPHGVRGCLRALRSYKRDYPDIYAAILKQRRGRSRKFHWSGLSRSALEQKVAPGSHVYRCLSWEAHALLSPIRDIQFSPDGGPPRVDLRFAHDQNQHADLIADSVGGMLMTMWDEFAELFGFRTVGIHPAGS